MQRRGRKQTRFYGPEMILEALEERIVLDATVDQHTQDHTDQSSPATQAADNPNTAAAQTATAPQTTAAAQTAQADAPHDTPADVFQQNLNVVLVSNAVDQIQALSDSATNGSKVIVYDGTHDTLTTLVSELKTLVDSTGEKIGHIALLTHGDPGVLKISEMSQFSSSTVDSDPAAWHTLGSLLAEGARIDLYGCDVGQGADGQSLVNSIAIATGSVVWASSDTTGSASVGANWDLEVHSAASALGSLIDTQALDHYSFVLDNSNMVNAGFETNSTAPWDVEHYATVVSASTGGNYGTFNAGASPFASVSTYMVRLAGIDGSGGELSVPSQISQTFQYQYPDSIVFAYDFVTSDGGTQYPGYDDFGYTLSINGSPVTAASLLEHAGTVNPSDFGNFHHTGWITKTIDPAAYGAQAGDMVTITFFAGNTQDTDYDSWGFVDLRQPPTVSASIPDQALTEDATPTLITLDPYFTDRETPDANLTYQVMNVTDPTLFDAVTVAGNVLTLDTAHNAFGGADITLRCIDQQGGMVDTTFHVNITNSNYDLPSGQAITITAPMNHTGDNHSVTFELIGYDPDRIAADPTQQKFEIYGASNPTGGYEPLHGTVLAVDESGAATTIQYDAAGKFFYQKFTYTPEANYWGDDSFQFVFETTSGTWKGFPTTGGGTAIGTETYDTYDLTLVDLGSNGTLDLVTANSDLVSGEGNHPNLYNLNDGSGVFGASQNMDTQVGLTARDSVTMATGDFNNDGYPDVVVRNNAAAEQDVVYLWNNTSGQFQSTVQFSKTAADHGVAVGDFNGDGNLDVLFGAGTSARIFWGNGNGTFNMSPYGLPAGTGTTYTVAAGDFNGDGYLDVFCGKSTNNQHAVYYNDGTGAFSTGHMDLLGASGQGYAYDSAVGDLDGDGRLDIVIARNGGGAGSENWMYKNTGPDADGTAAWTAVRIAADQNDTRSIRLADVDRDGHLDVLTADYANRSEARYYLYNGATFAAGVNIGNFGNGYYSLGVAVGDVDGDGTVDVVDGLSNQTNRLFDNNGFNLGTGYWRNGGPTKVSIHVEPIVDWSFEDTTGYNHWTLNESFPAEFTGYPAAILQEFATMGIVQDTAGGTTTWTHVKDSAGSGYDLTTGQNLAGGDTINYADTLHDYVNGNDQLQFSIQTLSPGITVDGSHTDHTAVLLSGGLRDATLSQTLTLYDTAGNLDQYLTGLKIEWDMSIWNANTDCKFTDTTQFVTLSVFNADLTAHGAQWTTTSGTNSSGGALTHYTLTLDSSNPLVQDIKATGTTRVEVQFQVHGFTWYLDAAIDDFKMTPIRSLPFGSGLAAIDPLTDGVSQPASDIAALDTASFAAVQVATAPLLAATDSLVSTQDLSVLSTVKTTQDSSLLSVLDASSGTTNATTPATAATDTGASFTGGLRVDLSGSASLSGQSSVDTSSGGGVTGQTSVASAAGDAAADGTSVAMEPGVDPATAPPDVLISGGPGTDSDGGLVSGADPAGTWNMAFGRAFDPQASFAFDLDNVDAGMVLTVTADAATGPLVGTEVRELAAKIVSGESAVVSLDAVRFTDFL